MKFDNENIIINNKKVSIILPVYNCETYLNRCLDSLVNQTFKNIEIIAINDGSTDRSLDILERYESNDNRIKVINKKNTGVSETRNTGLDESKGDYIIFVDSDDWIELNMIEDMVKILQRDDSDIVMCTYMREFKNHSKAKIFNLPKEVIYENEKLEELHRMLIGPINDEIGSPEGLDSLGTIWAKLYKKDSIKKKFVDLKEIGSAEDTLFNIFVFKNVKRISFINTPYYHYWRDNQSSITTRYNPNLRMQWHNLFRYINEFIKDEQLDDRFYEALNNRIAMSVLGLGLNECSRYNKISIPRKIKKIKEILNDKLIVNALDKFNMNYMKIHWRFFYKLNQYKRATCSYFVLNLIEFLRVRI